MKNIPHQIVDLDKLHAALGVLGALAAQGADLNDDGIVGAEMARQGVYAFRNKAISINEALTLEAQKPRGSQGSRTFARDLRRFFLMLSFVGFLPDGSLSLTPLGEELLRFPSRSPESFGLWRRALQHLALADEEGNISHPYGILLRLTQERPGIDTARLALALEAQDDSEEEFARILGYVDRKDWSAALEGRGVSQHMQRNAIKILPALARQLRDILEDRGRNSLGAIQTNGENDIRSPGTLTARAKSRAQQRTVDARTIAALPMPSGRIPDVEDYADPTLSAAQRLARLERHNRLVQRFAHELIEAGYRLFESPYDALAIHEVLPSVLLEVKTLDGSIPDEVARVRGALAQLQYYERFAVSAEEKQHGLVKLGLFERRPTNEHVQFLEALGVVTVWQIESDSWASAEYSRRTLQGLGFSHVQQG